MKGSKEAFFIGWALPPKELRVFLAAVAGLSIAAFALAAYVTAATQSDAGSGSFRWDWGAVTLRGVITTTPYPVLHVREGEHGFAGRSVMLAGPGKRGVIERVEALEGTLVDATGVMLTRGDLAMMQVRGNESGLVPVPDAPKETIASTDLGTWRLTGEICDGKCYAGAMRPGTGLAHKACANLCLAGGVPPVFVATGGVDGAHFFLLGDKNGNPLPQSTFDWTAVLATIDGKVVRHGNMPVFHADIDTAKLAQ